MFTSDCCTLKSCVWHDDIMGTFLLYKVFKGHLSIPNILYLYNFWKLWVYFIKKISLDIKVRSCEQCSIRMVDYYYHTCYSQNILKQTSNSKTVTKNIDDPVENRALEHTKCLLCLHMTHVTHEVHVKNANCESLPIIYSI